MKVVLHTCCGPCASACVPRLKDAGYEVTMLFANSNIDTQAEFEKRCREAERLAKADGVKFVALPYDHEKWLTQVARGYESAPEKGERCARCFKFNLAEASKYAAAHGFDAFTTSLTVSPHKVSQMVFAASDDERFLKTDFKKQDGFKLSLKRSAELGLYRQSYCGCEFSKEKTMIILASGSPRRAKILEDLGVKFTVLKTDAPETSYPDDPERTVSENALAKGAAAKGTRVLSADTIVWFGGRIYGKPKDLEEAKEFLRELSGKTHIVYTGVAFDGEVKIAKSEVKFRELSESAIAEYVAKVKPVDRAGAYDIDESGDLIVESYRGSYENIMGLPVEPLKEWGIVK